MKALLWIAGSIVLAAAAVGCGSSPQSQCQNGVKAVCNLFSRCNDGGYTVTNNTNGCAVAVSGFTINIGTLQDGGPSCFAGMTGCEGTDGGTYNSANADACVNQVNAATCDQSQTTFTTGVCAQVCQ